MVFQPALTFRYQTLEDKADRKLATDTIKTAVLTDDFVIRMMEIVVTQYFVLRPSDLRDWETEPDEWERREEEIADAWEFSIRSCSEKLFLDLVINFKEVSQPLSHVYELATISYRRLTPCHIRLCYQAHLRPGRMLTHDSSSYRNCSRFFSNMRPSTTHMSY